MSPPFLAGPLLATEPTPLEAAARAGTRSDPAPGAFEDVRCYGCGADGADLVLVGEDDLGGRPGAFRFVRCRDCALVYQRPRLRAAAVRGYYDADYPSHRAGSSWGPLTPLVRRAFQAHDRRKEALVAAHVRLSAATRVLDVGCATGSFLSRLRTRHGVHATGLDWIDVPGRDPAVELLHGALEDVPLAGRRFDLVTMWHFLEHAYDPPGALRAARDALAPDGRLVIEVPDLESVSARLFGRRWPGVQAPQHTVLFTRATLRRMVEAAGLEVVSHERHGAFPPYFYLFCGAVFRLRDLVGSRRRGLDLRRLTLPYFLGRLALWPLDLLERRVPFAMQTLVCRRP